MVIGSRILGRRYHIYGYSVWTLFFYVAKCESVTFGMGEYRGAKSR